MTQTRGRPQPWRDKNSRCGVALNCREVDNRLSTWTSVETGAQVVGNSGCVRTEQIVPRRYCQNNYHDNRIEPQHAVTHGQGLQEVNFAFAICLAVCYRTPTVEGESLRTAKRPS